MAEEYGGANALATAIIVEEIARGCVSSSLIRAVNNLVDKGSLTRELASPIAAFRPTESSPRRGHGLTVPLRTLDHTRITIASRAVGVDQGALDYAIGYVKERKQFGQRIVEFQGIQIILAAKAFASDAAMEITTDAVRLLGGAEYVVDHQVERMMRDAKIIQICEGTDQVQRLVMGRSLLS